MKKLLTVVAAFALTINLAACGGGKTDGNTDKPTPPTVKNECDSLSPVSGAKEVKVGMVTDSGTIDDKSFNQGTWEGIKCYTSKNPGKDQYQKPTGEATTDYLASIQNLVDNGYEMIVTPGFKFEQAIFEAQTKFPDVKFVLIDGQPHNGDYNFVIGENTVSILYAEHEAGFLAGVAAALNSTTGKLGFIGGMEIPAVQKFGWGYVAGVAYANKNFGTNASVVDYLYQGTFNDVQAGQTLAAGMYEKGIDIIFHAAGGVGVGVFNEAKTRAEGGEKVMVVGVDVDQYNAGVYGDGTKSVTLTSAMKRLGVSAYDFIGLMATDKFEGGKLHIYDIKNNGVGLPVNNPNMSADSVTKADQVKEAMVAGTIVVPASVDELNAFLTENGYTTPTGIKY